MQAQVESQPIFRTRYMRPLKVTLDCGTESQVQQNMRDECDVNNILKKFQANGELPNLNSREPIYGDFSDPVEYQQALNIVIEARAQFDALSAHVRERFDNDPEKFLAFCSDSKNSEEMVKLGLATKREVPDQAKPKIEPKADKKPARAEAKAEQEGV